MPRTHIDRMEAILMHLQASDRLVRDLLETGAPIADLAEELSAIGDLANRAKAAAEALEVMRSQFDTVLVHSHSAIIGIDTQGVVTNWNGSATRIFGWAVEEAVGLPLDRLIIPERYRTAYRDGLAAVVAGGPAKSVSVFYRVIAAPALRRTGEEFPILLSVGPSQVGTVWRFFAFITDPSQTFDVISVDALLAQSEKAFE